MAKPKPAQNATKLVNGIALTDTEDQLVQEVTGEIVRLWNEYLDKYDDATAAKIAVGEYIFKKIFGNNESKLYDDKDKYNPKKTNSYASLMEAEVIKKLDITPQTLRNMVYSAVTAKYLKKQNIDIKEMIKDKESPWTYTHLKYLARLERSHEVMLALVKEVNEKRLTSRQLEEMVQPFLPKKTTTTTGEEPKEYHEILPNAGTLGAPVMKFQRDIDRLMAYNPTDDNDDSGNYVDKVQVGKIHDAIKDTIADFNNAIKSLKALEAKLQEKEKETGSEAEDAPAQEAA